MARVAIVLALAACLGAAAAVAHRNEVWTAAQEAAAGIEKNSYRLPRPHEYLDLSDLPDSWTWGNVSGVNYLTRNRNQHLPQYCGSCWAHGSLSALADRVKIARKAQGIDIDLSVQYILNCGTAGSCHGGSATGVYQYIKRNGAKGVPFDTCQPYIACSSESMEGFCAKVRSDTTCNSLNTCRTCPTFGEPCQPIDIYPNVTVAEFGEVSGEANMMAEIYARGPIAAGIDAVPILDYQGGVVKGMCQGVDHIVSIVGWGVDNGQKYWIVRNSWGEYWGEGGYVRVAKGNNALCLESSNSWATPAAWTEVNYPCDEGGDNCDKSAATVSHGVYVDPALRHLRSLHLKAEAAAPRV